MVSRDRPGGRATQALASVLSIAAGALLVVGCARGRPAESPGAEREVSLYNDAPAQLLAQQQQAEQTLATLGLARARVSVVIAHALRMGAVLWVETHSSCPTAADIVDAHLVSDRLRADDAWDNPYQISCRGGLAPEVRSAGPDGVLGTGDDIVAGDAP